ncbi:PQQ-dependent sugar dehydrogenase [Pseudarthrobacter sp. NPDC092424]|uniref:PQQ-dependent sugar dehydrogenase n=1 Tax=Pseudarthrobacter sp. NPDC092424 TaxID=3364415 RepID=UPI0038234B71
MIRTGRANGTGPMVAAALLFLLAACSSPDAAPTQRPGATVPSASGTSPVAAAGSSPAASSNASRSGGAVRVAGRLDLRLDIPWSGVFLPDGTAVVSERGTAALKAVRGADATLIGTVPGVAPAGEGGLLGLALSPGFATDRLLYAYLTSDADNRVVRLRLADSGNGALSLGAPEVVFAGIPKAATHNGGRIRFGPDGYLYVGTGDSQRRDQPQDPAALGGKILRLTPDGGPAPGNPFGNAVYSLGHRNVQGLAWDTDGRLWATEFGPDVDDELNLILPGANYGWPEVTGAPGRPEFQDAKVVWPTSDASPSGLEIAGSTAYVGALRGQRLWTIPLSGTEAGKPVAHFTGMYGRIRDVVRTPEGGFWLLTNNQNPDFAVVLGPAG